MSISIAEFATSIALMGPHTRDTDGWVTFDLPTGRVVIRFIERPGVRLGGLLALPRAEVSLRFDDKVSAADRAQFVQRFDMAFQRGGG
ncbi:MAG: hypothetical protein ACRCS9_16440 [Hyphomicrobium sp.]